ncbi:MAG: hypothetical protein ABWY48_06350 [Pseudoxanthomonas sp.]
MKKTFLALVIVVSCGSLAACKKDSEPVAEAPPPAAAEPVVTPAPEPVLPEPVVTDPAVAPPAAADAAGTGNTEEEEDDTPHSGGDKVAPVKK